MSLKLIWVALMALLTTLATPVWASELPTSENPARTKWEQMRPTSFAPTPISALEQCNRAANANENDRLTTAMCQRLPEMLSKNQCHKVLVKDGIVFDYMNGRVSGHSGLTKNVEKSLGREDSALLCDLGNRTFAYWFVGDKGRSCNNVGIVFTALPPAPVAGVCGSNARHYMADVTSWPAEGKFCALGTPSTPLIAFPDAGSNTIWTCEGQNGGKSTICPASREALPPPPKVVEVPPEKGLTCTTVKNRYIVSSPGQIVNVPGLPIPVCRGIQPLPDTFVNLPPGVIVVTRDDPVCK